MNPKFPSKMLKSSFLSGKSNRSQSTMALDRDYEVIEPRPTQQTLQSTAVPLRCDLCGSMKALVRCEQCSNRVFCFVCDETFHKHPKRNRHNRKALQKESTLQRPPLPPKSIQEVRVTVTPPQPPPRKNKKSFFLSSLTQKFEIQSEPHKGLVAFGNSLKNVFSNRPLPPTPQENKLGSNFSKNQFSHNSSLPNSVNPTFKPKSQSVSAENWSKFLDFSNENSQNFVNSQNFINTSQKFSDLSSQKSQNFADIPKQMPQNFANNVPQKVHEQPNLKESCKLFRNSPKEEVFHEFPKSRSRENSIGIPRNVSHEFNSTNSVCNLNSDVQNKFFQPVSFLGNQDMMTSGFHQMSLMNLNPCLHSPLNCQPQHLLQPMTKSTSNQSMNNANLHDISGGGIYPFAPPMHSHVAFPYYGYYPGYAPGYVPGFSDPSPIRHGSAMSIPDFVRGCNRVPSSPAPSARSSSNRSLNCSRGRSFSFSNSQSGGHKTTGARGGTGSSVRASEIESAFSSTPGSSENEQPDSFSKHRKGNQSWQCEHCTFINRMSARICGMCSKKPENLATHENSLDINSNSRIQKSHTSDRYFRKNQREKAGSREYQSQSNLKSLDYFRCSSKTPNHMPFTSPNSSSEFENFPDFQNEHFRKNKNIEANYEPKDNISKKKETGSRYRNRKKYMTDRSMTPGRNSPLRISKNERVYSGNKSSTECRNVDSVKVSSRRKEETICRDSTGRKVILGGCSLKIKNSKRPKENRTWRSFSQGNLNENVTGRVNSDSSDAKSLDEKNISPFLNRKILIKNSGSGKQKSSMKIRYASQKSKETLANEYIAVHEQNSKNERPRKSNDAAQYRCQTNRNSRAEKEKPFTSKTNRNQETMRQINAKNSHFDNRNYQYLTKDESSDSVENENLDSETSINNGSIDSENNEVSSSEISETENLASENSENVASENSSYVENSENESIDNEISSGSDKLFYGEKENSNYINRENLNKHVKQYLASDSEDNNEIFIANAQIRKNSSQGLKNVSITNFKAKKYDNKSNKIDTKSCTNRAKNSSRLKKDTHPQYVENLEERLHSESKEKEVDPKFTTKLKLNFIESKTSIAPTKSERKAAKVMSKQTKTKAKSKESESKSKNMESKSVSRNSLSSSDLFYSTPNSPALCQNKRSPEHDKLSSSHDELLLSTFEDLKKGLQDSSSESNYSNALEGFEENDKSEESKIYETLVSPILKKMIAEITRKGEEIPEISKSLKQKIVEALSQEDSELNDIQLAPNDVSENEELEDYSEGSSKKSPKSKAVNLPVKSNESFVQKLGESKLDSIPWIEDYDDVDFISQPSTSHSKKFPDFFSSKSPDFISSDDFKSANSIASEKSTDNSCSTSPPSISPNQSLNEKINKPTDENLQEIKNENNDKSFLKKDISNLKNSKSKSGIGEMGKTLENIIQNEVSKIQQLNKKSASVRRKKNFPISKKKRDQTPIRNNVIRSTLRPCNGVVVQSTVKDDLEKSYAKIDYKNKTVKVTDRGSEAGFEHFEQSDKNQNNFETVKMNETYVEENKNRKREIYENADDTYETDPNIEYTDGESDDESISVATLKLSLSPASENVANINVENLTGENDSKYKSFNDSENKLTKHENNSIAITPQKEEVLEIKRDKPTENLSANFSIGTNLGILKRDFSTKIEKNYKLDKKTVPNVNFANIAKRSAVVKAKSFEDVIKNFDNTENFTDTTNKHFDNTNKNSENAENAINNTENTLSKNAEYTKNHFEITINKDIEKAANVVQKAVTKAIVRDNVWEQKPAVKEQLSKKRLVIPPAVASFSGPIFIPTTLNEDFEEHEYINHTPHRSDSINVGDTVNKQMNVEISEENADEHEKNSQIKDLKKRIELSSTSSQIKELRQEIKTIKKELESEAINRKSDSDQNISESDQDNEMESEHDSVKSEQNELKIRRAEGKLEHNKAENETNLETKLPEITNEQEFENENKLGAERKEEETKQQGAESQINTMKNKLAVEHNFNSDDTNLSNDYNKESFDNSTSNFDNSTANTSQNLPGLAKPESEIIRQVSPQILVQNFKTSEERELGSSFLSSPKFQTLKSMINTNEKTQEQKEQLEFDRKVRRFLAEGQAETYDKAELAAHLTNLNFEENEALQAAENCSSIYTAMKFLQQYCELCDDKFPMGKMVSMLHCTHRCCIDCARSYFSTQIKTKSIHDLRCPFCFEPDLDKCEDSAAEYLNNLDILLKNIVEVDIHELFQRKLRDWTLMKEPNFRWCNKCSSGFISNPRARKLICPDCRDVTCSSCRKQWAPEHVGISCENFAKWLRENDPDNFGVGEGVAKHLAENGITCPNCRFTYSLAKGGCMHFTCTECKYEFCSGCSEPFKQGAKCTVGPYCERLGLHSHHPRNCLFYLRDKEPEVLQKLLKDHNIEFFTEPLIENETGKDICRISIQKETKDGFEDDICGRITREGNAGMCKAHYIEYLVEKVNNNRLDPVIIFDEADLRVCLRRNGKTVPMRRWESENHYRDKLIKLITEQLPLM